MATRGIRGAITIATDTKKEVLDATRELLDEIFAKNPDLNKKDIASTLFTTTEDVSAAYPALATREMGWGFVPMICAREIPVPGSLVMCIRVLIHWNTDLKQEEIKHIYLHGAKVLRPDLVEK